MAFRSPLVQPQFSEEETEAQSNEMTCSRAHELVMPPRGCLGRCVGVECVGNELDLIPCISVSSSVSQKQKLVLLRASKGNHHLGPG